MIVRPDCFRYLALGKLAPRSERLSPQHSEALSGPSCLGLPGSGLLLFALLASAVPVAQAQSPSLAEQARTAYAQHHFAESAALYRQAIRDLSADDRAEPEYDLACSEALAGQQDAALQDLAASVRDGFTDADHIRTDPDLQSLHADPRFTAAVTTAEQAVKQGDQRWGTTAFKTAYTPNLPDADKLAGLSLVWAEGKFSFGNSWHVPDLNWDQLYRDTIPKVLATTSTYDYYRVLQHMIAQLHDGHSNVYMPEALDLNRLPFLTALTGDHVFISRLLGTAADQQGVQLGDEILTVNGEPVHSWAVREVEPYQSASSPQDLLLRTFSYMLFVAPHGTVFTLGVRSGSSAQVRTLRFPTGDYPAPVPPFAFRMLPGNIAYVALNEFGDDVDAHEWDSHWPQIAKARGLVLDVRLNGGGSDSIGSHVLATLVSTPVPAMLVRSNRWIASYRAWGRVETPLTFPVEQVSPDPQHQFTGPVVMLTGPRTFSAGEDLVVAFRSAHRGSIVGQPTGGSTGQPLGFDLPGGGSARICTLHDSFVNGTEFVGVGVPPDVVVTPSMTDLLGKSDTTLDRAVQQLGAERAAH